MTLHTELDEQLDASSDDPAHLPELPELPDDPDTRTGPGAGGWRRWWNRIRHRADRAGVRQFATPASTRVFLLLLVVGLLCGPTALLLAGTSGRNEPVPAVASTSGESDRDVLRAGTAASDLVRVWLSAAEADAAAVKAVMGRDPGQISLPAHRPAPPAWVAVKDAQQSEPGEWTVTVAAASGATGASAVYTVLVAVDDRQAAALTLPARISTTPLTSADVQLSVLSSSDPAAVTVTGFLRSLLTGSDDLSRWLAPDSPIRPVGHPCRAIRVDRIETAQAADIAATGRDVLATATCQTSPDGADLHGMQYPLTLQLRDGRWEIVHYATSLPGMANPATPTGASSTTPAPTDPSSSPGPSGTETR